MRVRFFNPDTCDCTADPHIVCFDTMYEVLDAIERVCESDVVRYIVYVNLEFYKNKKESGSDECIYYKSGFLDYTKIDKRYISGKTIANKIDGLVTARSKVMGLEPGIRKLPHGLEGVKKAIELIKKRPRQFKVLTIGVIWKAFMEHNCSDFIEYPPMPDGGDTEVDFSNQDYYIKSPKYKEHCAQLSKVIGIEGCIEPSESGDEE